MIKKAKIIVRKVIFLPLHLFNKLSQLYVALIGFIDPNGSECCWGELSQKQIDSRTGSNLKFKHQEYKPNNFNSVKYKICKREVIPLFFCLTICLKVCIFFLH